MYFSRSYAFIAVAGSSLVAAAPAGGYCAVQPPKVTSSSAIPSSTTASSVVAYSVAPYPVASSSAESSSIASSSVASSSVESSSIASSSIISSSVVVAPTFIESSSVVTPTPTPTPSAACDPHDSVILILPGYDRAVCRSILGGDKTVEETMTVTVTGDAVTATITDAPTTVTTDTETVESITVTTTLTQQLPDVTTTTTATVTAPESTVTVPAPTFDKRDGPTSILFPVALPTLIPTSIPFPLNQFPVSRISSACSCVVTPTTTTVTTTSTQTLAGPQVTYLAPGSTVTATNLVTIHVTLPATETITALPTETVTETVTTTTTPVVTVTATPTPVTPPATCNVRGLPGPRAFNYAANFNTNQAACIATCKTDARCGSTGFYQVTNPNSGAVTGTCRYYDKSVADSASLGVGYYTFNDKAC
ncbi:hypothetical protein E8E13_000016 [Curvularia kusanoi]|uniref:Apple domain-containing protein n=1 Tax=Curvularia kusanoi TaxID=90978 RepID=A0A9P4W6H0_CURKU|nr:hypothetical protein E8E13_000016 [Curvularia kusanoi]